MSYFLNLPFYGPMFMGKVSMTVQYRFVLISRPAMRFEVGGCLACLGEPYYMTSTWGLRPVEAAS